MVTRRLLNFKVIFVPALDLNQQKPSCILSLFLALKLHKMFAIFGLSNEPLAIYGGSRVRCLLYINICCVDVHAYISMYSHKHTQPNTFLCMMILDVVCVVCTDMRSNIPWNCWTLFACILCDSKSQIKPKMKTLHRKNYIYKKEEKIDTVRHYQIMRHFCYFYDEMELYQSSITELISTQKVPLFEFVVFVG